jgi:predicted nucleotidyltransferase
MKAYSFFYRMNGPGNKMDKIINNNLNDIETLCKKHKVQSLYVFGSAATDRLTPNSDVDLLVTFESDLIKGYLSNYFSMAGELEQVFNKNVDLVEQNAMTNPYFIESVNESKVLIYEQ